MKKKRIGIILMVTVMMLGMQTFAYADDTVPTIDVKNAKVTKHLEMAEGIAVPDTTINFKIESKTVDAPKAAIDTITYSDKDEKGELNQGKYTISKEAEISFGVFSHAGVYEYTVTEESGTVEGMTYSSESYSLRVYVVNQEDGTLDIQSITAEKDNGKQEEILFTNTYVKNGSLSISKNTVGILADKTKDFEFKIEFIKSATESESVTSYEGKIGEESVVCNIGQEQTFSLHDQESLIFENLPAGTRYVVTEVGATDGYTPTVNVVENGQTTVVNKSAADNQSLVSTDEKESNLVGEGTNTVIYTNTYEDTPVTGVILENLPYILLAGMALLAIVILSVLRSSKKNF